VAIVAGTNLILYPDFNMWLSNKNFNARDGKSKSFDVSADGYGRGEGVAVVVLKSLEACVEGRGLHPGGDPRDKRQSGWPYT
jgi:acyl transferase domain-containing protein